MSPEADYSIQRPATARGVIERTAYRLAASLGTLLDGVVQALVVSLDSASHKRTKQREEQAADILDVGE